MPVPVLPPTQARDETFGGVTYHIEGELVPALHVELTTMPVYFEHHILLWKDPGVEVSLRPLKGAFKRVLSGMPVFMTQAKGPGRIAFSRDGAGHVFALHLKVGQAVDVKLTLGLAGNLPPEIGGDLAAAARHVTGYLFQAPAQQQRPAKAKKKKKR